MKINHHDKMTDAAFREFLAAASGLAFECCESGRDGYRITREAFVEMLRDALPRRMFIGRHFHAIPHIH